MRWRSSAAQANRIGQVANELGIYDSTLGNWVRQDEINRGEREGLSTDERENARLRMERELEKTSCGVVGAGVERVTLYRFVDAEAAEGFPVRLVCSVVGVSPSAYYAHKQRPQSGPAQLAEAVLTIIENSPASITENVRIPPSLEQFATGPP